MKGTRNTKKIRANNKRPANKHGALKASILKGKSKKKTLPSKTKARRKSHSLKKNTTRGNKSRQTTSGTLKNTRIETSRKPTIVRIMGHGQYTVDSRTLKRLNDIDRSIVDLVSNERSDDNEFRKQLLKLAEIVTKNGKPLDPKEIIQSDIILPSPDLSIDEAKKLFKGEGVIPEF